MRTRSGSDPTEHTLFGTMQEIVESYHEFIRELGVQEHVEQVTWELLQSEHSLFAANAATLYDDTVPTLKYLRDAGFKLAIVSNWDTPLDPLTQRLGIAHYFDVIVASHDARVSAQQNRIHTSSTIHSQQSGFQRRKPFMLETPTKQILLGQKMQGFVRY